ncbi:hypothetical protein OH77DRAFT_988552 [Trametes cingulata]|nr:hypothetical protein OH77DRAFT_988552 [Trametes cingulata]
MDAIAAHNPRQRDPRISPSDTLVLHDARQALSYAHFILSRDPRVPLTDVPPALVLGFDISARQPPLLTTEWDMLWNMLRRMAHLERLTVEDGDGLMMDVVNGVSARMPLSLPRLKYLKFCMSFSLDGCHAFFSLLRDAPLDELVLFYPNNNDREEDSESPEPVALLAKASTAATLSTLHLENLRYSYLDLMAPAAQFPFVRDLTLRFRTDTEDPSRPIMGYLLAAFPAVKVLYIRTTHSSRAARQPSLEEIHRANIDATTHASAKWSLESITGSVLDLWILGLDYPSTIVEINEVDLFTVRSLGNFMSDLFSGSSPGTLYVTFTESPSCNPEAMALFFQAVLAYWKSSPSGTIPKQFTVELRMIHGNKLGEIMRHVLALLRDGTDMEQFRLTVHLRCKDVHFPPPPKHRPFPSAQSMDVDEAESSEESTDESDSDGDGLVQCKESQDLFRKIREILDEDAQALQAASINCGEYLVKATSYCSPHHGLVVSGGEKIRRWLPSSH